MRRGKLAHASADRACRPADGECARGSVRRQADDGDGGRHVPAAAVDLGRPETGRRFRLGPARPCARPALPRRRSGAGRRCLRSPASRRPGSTTTTRRSSASPAARAASLSGAATLPKGRPVQIDLRIFGSEGMLLLDIERERLELRRRDGQDEVVPMKPGDGAYACEEPLRVLVDLCLGRSRRITRHRASSASAPSRCSTRCTARPRATIEEKV